MTSSLSRSVRTLIAAASLAACAATTSKAPEAPLTVVNENASIPFVSLGGIRSWSARDDGSLLIEGTSGRFYRATFMGPCRALKFAGPGIAITSEAAGQTDRFSKVLVNGQSCPFATLDEVIDPKSRASAAPTAPVEGASLPPPTR
jgi:Family of unknown function (DUF6491)